ncbi:mechanosensitive ion channel family protein [Virgibacillus sp. 179-BFC.A HS]|uniref:Mechanosensitive ion channel family protein n=1 Tax=Tigheibacillus jepli TaxID=3035914 RepID=A0ABU5CCS8_9BACI|nr:mechanosensitive ion channel family protein [Virgibacillus sp. 179-BFC.A HS]MDY0404130.1 mechanosensitive ion channel family protein [Virgibacillus sp. 179-BFC.A HS]
MEKKVYDFWDFITGPDLWITIGQGLLKIILIAVLSTLVVKISKNVIERAFGRRLKAVRISQRREQTMKKLIQNVVAYVVYFTAILMILEVFTINIGALLAGAGVAGLAIGFGAQNLVRDIISGFFIIFEDQFSVGDYVSVAGVEGTVEEIGLRTTKVLSWTGEINVIPNGNITQVINYSIHNGLAVVDINVPYESDVFKAEKIIEEIAAGLPEKYEEIISVPEIIGVQSLEASYFVIRVTAETLPVYQWAGARMIRKEMKQGLYNAGIDIPSPRVVMYSRDVDGIGMINKHEGDDTGMINKHAHDRE